jgi:hypothetical protein
MVLSHFWLLWQLLQACNEMSFVIVIEKGDWCDGGMQIAYFKIANDFVRFQPGEGTVKTKQGGDVNGISTLETVWSTQHLSKRNGQVLEPVSSGNPIYRPI